MRPWLCLILLALYMYNLFSIILRQIDRRAENIPIPINQDPHNDVDYTILLPSNDDSSSFECHSYQDDIRKIRSSFVFSLQKRLISRHWRNSWVWIWNPVSLYQLRLIQIHTEQRVWECILRSMIFLLSQQKMQFKHLLNFLKNHAFTKGLVWILYEFLTWVFFGSYHF